MANVNQTRPHCVNQMGKTHSKPLAARHGRGTAWTLHESAFTLAGRAHKFVPTTGFRKPTTLYCSSPNPYVHSSPSWCKPLIAFVPPFMLTCYAFVVCVWLQYGLLSSIIGIHPHDSQYYLIPRRHLFLKKFLVLYETLTAISTFTGPHHRILT